MEHWNVISVDFNKAFDQLYCKVDKTENVGQVSVKLGTFCVTLQIHGDLAPY